MPRTPHQDSNHPVEHHRAGGFGRVARRRTISPHGRVDPLHFLGDGVALGKFWVIEDGANQPLGEQVLNQHLIHGFLADVGIQSRLAEREELGESLNEAGVIRVVVDRSPQLLKDDVQAAIEVNVSALWPKFLPQFVAPDAPSRVVSFLFLGAVFVFNGTLWCLVLVMGASALSGRLRRNASGARRLRQATGAVFVGLGARLALSK